MLASQLYLGAAEHLVSIRKKKERKEREGRRLMIGFLEALKEKLSFQKKTGQKICEAGQKEKKNEGRF